MCRFSKGKFDVLNVFIIIPMRFMTFVRVNDLDNPIFSYISKLEPRFSKALMDTNLGGTKK